MINNILIDVNVIPIQPYITNEDDYLSYISNWSEDPYFTLRFRDYETNNIIKLSSIYYNRAEYKQFGENQHNQFLDSLLWVLFNNYIYSKYYDIIELVNRELLYYNLTKIDNDVPDYTYLPIVEKDRIITYYNPMEV